MRAFGDFLRDQKVTRRRLVPKTFRLFSQSNRKTPDGLSPVRGVCFYSGIRKNRRPFSRVCRITSSTGRDLISAIFSAMKGI